MTRTADLADPLSPNGKEVLTPATRATWREWLEAHPDRVEGLWLVYRKKTSTLEGPDYDDLVEEALCFGWIDSRAQSVDDERQMLWFSPRRSGGFWSASNRERVERMMALGLMTDRGRTVIDAAKEDGTWATAEEVEALVLHPDLETALATHPGARPAYEALPDSTKKQHLWWVYGAKRPATRMDRIDRLIRLLTEPVDPSG